MFQSIGEYIFVQKFSDYQGSMEGNNNLIKILSLILFGWLVLFSGISIFIICLRVKHLEKLLHGLSKQFWIPEDVNNYRIDIYSLMDHWGMSLAYLSDPCLSQVFLAKQTDIMKQFTRNLVNSESSQLYSKSPFR